MTDALTAALPLAERAVDELESTNTPPLSLMLARKRNRLDFGGLDRQEAHLDPNQA